MRSRSLVVLALVLLPLVWWAAPALADWQPSKPVSVVVPYGAGGGTDVVIRALVAIVNEEQLAPTPWVVVNRTGGAGINAMDYVVKQSGDPHTLMALTPGHLVLPKLQNLKVRWTALTAVANLVIEPQILFTHAKSGYGDIKQFLAAARAKPDTVKVGGGPVGQDDHLTQLLFDQGTGVKTRYVAFSGGGELLANIAGGHVDAAWLNPSEVTGRLETQGGSLRPLAVALEKRLGAFPDVPTFAEAGHKVVYDMFFRGLVAPGGLNPEALKFYASVIAKATKQPRWTAFTGKAMTTPMLITGEEFKQALARWDATVDKLLPLIK